MKKLKSASILLGLVMAAGSANADPSLYKASFTLNQMKEYNAYVNTSLGYPRVIRKAVSPTFGFPVDIGENIEITFLYDPDVGVINFDSEGNHFGGAFSNFRLDHDYGVAHGFSVTADNATDTTVNRYDYHQTREWGSMSSSIDGLYVPDGLKIKDLTLQFTRNPGAAANAPYMLEEELSIDYFIDRYGRSGVFVYLLFDNLNESNQDGFKMQWLQGQVHSISEVSNLELQDYCQAEPYLHLLKTCFDSK